VEFLYSFFKKVTFLCIRSSQKGTASVTLQTKLTLSPVIWNTLDTSSTSSVIFHSFYGHKPDLDWEHAISRRDIGTAAVGPVGILLDINNALQNVAATSCETNMYCGPKKTDDGVAEMLRVLYRKTEAGWTCSAVTLRAKKSTCFSCFLRSCMNPTRSSRIRQVGPIFCRCRDHQHVRSSAD